MLFFVVFASIKHALDEKGGLIKSWVCDDLMVLFWCVSGVRAYRVSALTVLDVMQPKAGAHTSYVGISHGKLRDPHGVALALCGCLYGAVVSP